MAVIFDDLCASMKSFMHSCHESMMVDGHVWRKEAGESKLKFQGVIEESFRGKVRQENKRFENMTSQLRHQYASTARQWRNTRMFFNGERGAWADRYAI